MLVAACGAPPQVPATPEPPQPTATPVPKRPEDAAAAFFSAWQQGQYSAMYDMLSADAQTSIARDAFVRRYTNIHDGIGELKVSAQATGSADPSGQVPFSVTRTLAVFGDVTETNTLPLTQDQDGSWKVVWSPGLIFTGLTASTTVRVTPDVPKRGRI